MIGFTVTVPVAAPVDAVWDRITDWPAHGRWVPATRVSVLTAQARGLGARFVGRTGVGPLAFDDPMEVVEWRPPHEGLPARCRVVKQGRVVLGEAWFEVAPAAGGSEVTWGEQVDVAPVRLTRPFAPLLAVVGRAGFTRTLRAMAAELERERAGAA